MRVPCEEEFIPGTVTRLALTVDGLKFLATHAPEMIPDLPPLSEIEDKSKASNVSKAFACMQVVWFCMQCVERYLRKSPIILLEVVTMAHCLSALVIHCLWWKKPFEVVEPTIRIVSGEKMSAILSYMWMSTAVDYSSQSIGMICMEPEFESIHFCPNMVDRKASPRTTSFCHHSHNSMAAMVALQETCSSLSYSGPALRTFSGDSTSVTDMERSVKYSVSGGEECAAPMESETSIPQTTSQENLEELAVCKCCGVSMSTSQFQPSNVPGSTGLQRSVTPVKLLPGQYLSIAGFCLSPESSRFKLVDIFYDSVTLLKKRIYLEKQDINRWSLASLAITKYALPLPSVHNMNYLRLEASYFSGTELLQAYKAQFLWKIALINVFENVIYLIAWNYTPVLGSNYALQRIITRGNILFSFAPAINVVLLSGVYYCLRKTCGRLFYRRDAPSENGNSQSCWAIAMPHLLFILLTLLLYVGSKVLLLIDALMDMFYLPIEAYKVAPWANNFPHIL